MFENQVRKLVESFSVANASETEFNRTITQITRLLSSNKQYRAYESYENIIHKITQLINRNEQNGHQKSLYFLEKAQKLQRSPHLRKKCELLQVLELIIDDRESNTVIRPYANDRLQREQYKTDLETKAIHRMELDAPGLKGDTVDELLLIGDILYASQGIDTKLILNNCAVSNLRLMPSQKRLIRRLCLLGNYHNSLRSFISDRNKDNHENGLVLQSFLGAIDEELTSLYQLFGCLHEKLQSSFDVECRTENKMTLERLNVWFHEALKRLSLLNRFCSAIDGAIGGQIISQIYKFSRNGNQFERKLTESILNDICRPIFEMITGWIVDGVFSDPFDEFFIVSQNDNNNNNNSDIWKKKYILNRKHIPIFINKKLAKQIFCIGRNLNFIRVCCGDNYKLSQINCKSLKSFNISHLNEFFENIHKLSEITNKHLMNLMMNKFKVMHHAEVLRKYLLLCDGDFVEQFLIEIRDEMNKNASYIKIHEIQSKLESALDINDDIDDDIKQRLKVKILPHSGADCGWNVFVLNYCVDLPINVIFNENIMKKYQKVFVFLMKIKLAKSVLNECWKDQMRGNHKISVFPDIHYVKHCAYLVRHSMNEFLQIFESYFMFDVLNASWKTFKQNANEKHIDMDGLCAAHSQYINEILTKCFLNPNQEQKLKKPLEDILLQIHQFTVIYKELYHSLHKIQMERDTKIVKHRQDAQYQTQYQAQYQLLRKKQNEIIYVLKSFHNKIAKLLQLTKTNKIIPEYLERLLVQLDFNDFHFNSQNNNNNNNNNNMFSIDLPINPPPLNTFINASADNMLSKLDAVLKPTVTATATETFVPDFVFPKFTNNENKNANHFNKHRSTAPMEAQHQQPQPHPQQPQPQPQQQPKRHNILLSKIDSTIPHHLLPTPLQNKVRSKTSDVSQKYLFDHFDDSIIDLSSNSRSRSKTGHNSKMKRSRSSTPPQQHRFDFSYKPMDNLDNDNTKHISSPSGIQFSFRDNSQKIKEMMSPIPFSRNIAAINDGDMEINMDKDQWNRFIPTPLINHGQKTKQYR